MAGQRVSFALGLSYKNDDAMDPAEQEHGAYCCFPGRKPSRKSTRSETTAWGDAVSIKLEFKKSLYYGHAGSPMWATEEKGAFEENYNQALGKIKEVVPNLVREIEEAGPQVIVVSAIPQKNQLSAEAAAVRTSDTWANVRAGWNYQSLCTSEGMAKAYAKAAKSAYGAEPFRKLVEEYAAEVMWGEDGAILKLNLNEVGEQEIMCRLEPYNCLAPGQGFDCYVRWDSLCEVVGDPNSCDRSQLQHAWRNRPPWIGLAHELVHAWRFVTGRGIFVTNKAKDELLTTGLAPYENGKYSENGIRNAAGQPLRTEYGSDHSQ